MRTVTPEAEAGAKQILLALVAGQRCGDHPRNPATLMAITGHLLVHADDETHELEEGTWTACPSGPHVVEAVSDAAVLITLAPAHANVCS